MLISCVKVVENTKLEVAFKEEEKQCQDASESAVKMTPREEEDR